MNSAARLWARAALLLVEISDCYEVSIAFSGSWLSSASSAKDWSQFKHLATSFRAMTSVPLQEGHGVGSGLFHDVNSHVGQVEQP